MFFTRRHSQIPTFSVTIIISNISSETLKGTLSGFYWKATLSTTETPGNGNKLRPQLQTRGKTYFVDLLLIFCLDSRHRKTKRLPATSCYGNHREGVALRKLPCLWQPWGGGTLCVNRGGAHARLSSNLSWHGGKRSKANSAAHALVLRRCRRSRRRTATWASMQTVEAEVVYTESDKRRQQSRSPVISTEVGLRMREAVAL